MVLRKIGPQKIWKDFVSPDKSRFRWGSNPDHGGRGFSSFVRNCLSPGRPRGRIDELPALQFGESG